jgi:hypothetical protein
VKRKPKPAERYPGELDHLRDSSARMTERIRNLEARVAVANCALHEAYNDMDAARDELRRLRGLLGLVGAADRAMPEPESAP